MCVCVRVCVCACVARACVYRLSSTNGRRPHRKVLACNTMKRAATQHTTLQTQDNALQQRCDRKVSPAAPPCASVNEYESACRAVAIDVPLKNSYALAASASLHVSAGAPCMHLHARIYSSVLLVRGATCKMHAVQCAVCNVLHECQDSEGCFVFTNGIGLAGFGRDNTRHATCNVQPATCKTQGATCNKMQRATTPTG
jgi:hypothetical protein